MTAHPPADTEVLVLGAGPVGMFAALRLAQAGIRVAIVDKYRRSALHSYGLVLHAETLRLLEEQSLAAPLIERGQIVRRIAIHENEELVADLALSKIEGEFPFVLVASQLLLEGALEAGLNQNGVQVSWGHQALTFDSDDEGVTALLACLPQDGDPQDEISPDDVSTSRVRSKFLIAADGVESLGRRMLGVSCPSVGAPMTYGLLEFEAPLDDDDEMNLVLRDEATDVLWPLGPQRGRWSVQLPTTEAQTVDAEELKKRIRLYSPWFGDAFGVADWITTVSFRRCLAERFGRGRVWLAGDAAHYTSPIGVQSMNVGMREASDLAGRLVRILRENSSTDLLRYYNEERRREWRMLLGMDPRLQARSDTRAWASTLAPRLVSSLPATGRELNALLQQVGLRLNRLRRKNRGTSDYRDLPPR